MKKMTFRSASLLLLITLHASVAHAQGVADWPRLGLRLSPELVGYSEVGDETYRSSQAGVGGSVGVFYAFRPDVHLMLDVGGGVLPVEDDLFDDTFYVDLFLGARKFFGTGQVRPFFKVGYFFFLTHSEFSSTPGLSLISTASGLLGGGGVSYWVSDHLVFDFGVEAGLGTGSSDLQGGSTSEEILFGSDDLFILGLGKVTAGVSLLF